MLHAPRPTRNAAFDTGNLHRGSVEKPATLHTPEGTEVIQQHLAAWERYLYSNHGLDPIVLMAAAHYQFEAIHPFYDGNGRTGRILNILLLLQEGVLDLPVLYLSGHIVDNKSEYYRFLRAVTAEGAWEEWILFMTEAVTTSAQSTFLLIDAISNLQSRTTEQVRSLGIAPAAELTELLFVQPYVRINDVVGAGLAQRQTASAWLSQLAAAGVVEEHRAGRSKVFLNTAALEVLTSR
ncbi:Fic family protein [Corynebacterium aquatimens]|uniref:Fic family protein n=1 Tax=Corynebacterium aquatimens TaxID=1190508 RepID=UPI003313BE3C